MLEKAKKQITSEGWQALNQIAHLFLRIVFVAFMIYGSYKSNDHIISGLLVASCFGIIIRIDSLQESLKEKIEKLEWKIENIADHFKWKRDENDDL